MRFIARCVHGLEWMVAAEISSSMPGATGLALDRREVTFTVSDRASDLLALLTLATVDDVFAEVGRFGGLGTTKAALPDLARGVARLPWRAVVDRLARVRPLRPAPLIDVVASLEGRRNYSRFAVEQIAGEVLSGIVDGHYLPRTADGREPGDPALTVRLFVRGDEVIAALRVGEQPAHRRRYKLDAGPGTLHPPVAAALARLVRPQPGALVLDPFGGDGTIAIETALAFPGSGVVVRDADPDRVASASRNAARAGVALDVARADAGSLTGIVADAIITNPPWDLAVDAAGSLAGSLDPFWARVPTLLTPGGKLVVLADSALGTPKMLQARGFALSSVFVVRLAGRICHVVLAGPPGAPPPAGDPAAEHWRAVAEAAGAGLGRPAGTVSGS